MNILFVTFYFPPEVGAPQRRIWEFAQKLKERGHRVKILTGFPNYPHGKLIAPYRRGLFLRENMDGLEVLRVFHFFGNRRGKWGRALAEGSFAVSASLAALLEPALDIAVVESPSLLSCWAGVLLKRMRESIFVMHVSDLIPNAAVAVAMLSPGRLTSALDRLANFFYGEANGLIAITESVGEQLRSKGVAASKICVIPNGVDDRYLVGESQCPENGKFRVVYAGTHGRAYNLRTVLEAARRLPMETFEFEFIGDGIDRPELEKEAVSLPQVKFKGGLTVENMFERLRQCRAMVVPLADNPGLEATIPCKMIDAMAVCLPVVLAARKGELVDILRENRAGIVVEPDNPEALAKAIQYLQANPEEAVEMGRRGRTFVQKTRSRSLLVEKLEEMLHEIVAQK